MIYEIRSRATRAPLGAFEAETPEEAIAALLIERGISSDSASLLSVNLDGLEVLPEGVAYALECSIASRALGWAATEGADRGLAFLRAEQDAERVERVRLERLLDAPVRFQGQGFRTVEEHVRAALAEDFPRTWGEKPRPFDGPTYALGKG